MWESGAGGAEREVEMVVGEIGGWGQREAERVKGGQERGGEGRRGCEAEREGGVQRGCM